MAASKGVAAVLGAANPCEENRRGSPNREEAGSEAYRARRASKRPRSSMAIKGQVVNPKDVRCKRSIVSRKGLRCSPRDGLTALERARIATQKSAEDIVASAQRESAPTRPALTTSIRPPKHFAYKDNSQHYA